MAFCVGKRGMDASGLVHGEAFEVVARRELGAWSAEEFRTVGMHKDREMVRVAMEVGTGDGGREVSALIVADLEVLGDGTSGAENLGHNVEVSTDDSKPSLESGASRRPIVEVGIDSEDPQDISREQSKA